MIAAYAHVRDPRRQRVLRLVEMLGYVVGFALLSTRLWWWGALVVAVCVGMTLVDIRERVRAEKTSEPSPAPEAEDPVMFVVSVGGGGATEVTLSMVRDVMRLPWDAIAAVLDPAGATGPQQGAAAASGLVDLGKVPPALQHRGVVTLLVVHGMASGLTLPQREQIQLVAAGEPPTDLEMAQRLAAIRLLTVEPRKDGAHVYVASPLARAVAVVLARGEVKP